MAEIGRRPQQGEGWSGRRAQRGKNRHALKSPSSRDTDHEQERTRPRNPGHQVSQGYNRVSEYLKGRSEMETFAVSTSFICRLDWKNEKATKVIRDYLDADFQVNNPWWGASIDGTPGYDDGTQLEYSYPYIGNWETGQKWQLTAQFGIVKSVCLRPTELTMRNLK